jgi:hypothetical protein
MLKKLNRPPDARLTGCERIVLYRLFYKKRHKEGAAEGRR